MKLGDKVRVIALPRNVRENKALFPDLNINDVFVIEKLPEYADFYKKFQETEIGFIGFGGQELVCLGKYNLEKNCIVLASKLDKVLK